MKTINLLTTKFLAFTFTCTALLALNLNAQHFEGAIAIQTIDKDKKIEEMMLFVKEDRLKFVGTIPGANTMVPVSGESLLLRADQNDMVIFGDDKFALKINFQEIGMLLNMFNTNNSQSRNRDTGSLLDQSSTVITETGETRRIHGYTAKKTKITDKDNPNIEAHVWMTDEIKIDWVRMLNTFGSLTEMLGIDDFQKNYGIDFTKTPLLIQSFENKNLTTTIQISHIDERRLSKDEIDVPEGYELMTFFQMMMRQDR